MVGGAWLENVRYVVDVGGASSFTVVDVGANATLRSACNMIVQVDCDRGGADTSAADLAPTVCPQLKLDATPESQCRRCVRALPCRGRRFAIRRVRMDRPATCHISGKHDVHIRIETRRGVVHVLPTARWRAVPFMAVMAVITYMAWNDTIPKAEERIWLEPEPPCTI
jgi:hypothetical protein